MNQIRELALLLARVKNPSLIEAFLHEILTEAEAHEISSRWELVKRLYKGESQRHIAETLGVSLCKITRGSRELKKPGSALETLLRLQGEEDGRPAARRTAIRPPAAPRS